MKATMKTDTKMYSILMSEIRGVPHRVMMSLIKHMTEDMNIIIVSGKTMDLIKNDTCVSEQQVRDSMSKLIKLGLIEKTRLLKCEYVVSPILCYKGSEQKTLNAYSKIENQRRNKVGTVNVQLVYSNL